MITNLAFSITSNMMQIILFVLIINSMLLLAAKIMLEDNFNAMKAQNVLINQEFGLINQNIKKINNDLKDCSTVQQAFVPWSLFLAGINEKIPAGVRLFNISINKNEKTAAISGFAVERANLLNFKQHIERIPYLTNINFPLVNLLMPHNINFSFTTDIKIDKILPEEAPEKQ
jgi:hypothetical protein